MGVDSELERIEEENEIEDARFSKLSRKRRRQKLKEEMGEDTAQRLADQAFSLGKKALGSVKSIRIKSDTMKALHGMGNESRIKALNDPSTWRKR